MSKVRLRVSLILILFFLPLFLFSKASSAFAQVVINEFSSDTAGTTADPDWVEFYNSSDSSIDLSQFRLQDYAGVNVKNLSGQIGAKGFISVDWSNKLNKAGDEISLIKISDGGTVDKVGYGDKGADVSAPGPGQSAGRQKDGDSSWVILSLSTKGLSNDTSAPASTNTPTSVPTPEAVTSAPTSVQNATYKINEVKNESGEALSSAKIYVDGSYIHHYAPEILKFCDSCECDAGIACSFGQHTIGLEKSGYENWVEVKIISAGNSYEANPVMKEVDSVSAQASAKSPTVTPAKTAISLAGNSATPRGNISQSLPVSASGEILSGEVEATSDGQATDSSDSVLSPTISSPGVSTDTAVLGWREKLPGTLLILSGASLLIGSTILLWRKRASASSVFGCL